MDDVLTPEQYHRQLRDQVMRTLDIWQIEVKLTDSGLAVKPLAAWLPEQDARFIKRFKPLIIEALEHQRDITTTVGNMLGLTDDEFEQLRQEIAATPAGDPNLAFDTEAFALAERLRRLEQEDDHEAA
jgi:hypothetical protein